jgi:hypothetical protein
LSISIGASRYQIIDAEGQIKDAAASVTKSAKFVFDYMNKQYQLQGGQPIANLKDHFTLLRRVKYISEITVSTKN